PVILLPFTLSTYLSAEEIEIIILHELAHIKRNDYLINLAEQAMSVLLFFNPFAQLINRVINQERENSCDDIVIEASKKPLVYAHALLKLEQTRQQEWQLALAATGKKYHLLNRIERIMKTKKPIGNARHILLAFALLTASITGLAWLNPTIANGKISFNKIKPAIISNLFADTTKKKTSTYHHKSATAKKATVKAKYDEDSNYGFSYNDKELEKLSSEVGKYGEELGKYYNSPEFKKLSEELGEKGKELGDFYNTPQLKELQERQAEIAEKFGKAWGDNSETAKISGRLGELGGEVGKYYNTPEFKRLNAELEKKYGIPHERNYSRDGDIEQSENYKKYQEELKSHISPAEKEREEEMKKLGEQMRQHYDNPELRKAQEDMRLMGDSLRKAYHSPDMEKVKEQMRQLNVQMRAYQNSPELKRVKEEMRKAEARMKAYMKSPEFKKRMERMKRDAMNFKMDWNDNMNFNMNLDKPEKPEAPEKPEIEKPEISKPDAPEKPEAPEKPDTSDKQ
ncbi:MAG TPA: M56 family metallopeptidase, partial [Mucilaginibacter sp.]|nr:M56 family metallopeptidase [Mucilaginibacter sp.]